MSLSKFRKWISDLTFNAIARRTHKRKLQHEADTHRLFLYLSHHHLAGDVTLDLARHVEDLTNKALELGHEGRAAAVTKLLYAQVADIARSLDACLESAGDPRLPALYYLQTGHASPAMVEGHGPQGDRSWLGAGGRRRSTDVSGLAAEGGSLTDRAGSRDRARAPIVNQSGSLPIQAFEGPTAASPGHSRVVLPGPRLSDMLKERLGYTVQVAPSSVQHPAAGDGLWLRGDAKAGAIAALYPGILYPAAHHRSLPGYPRVDKGNDTLFGRFDGGILDALPWGRGSLAESRHGSASVAGPYSGKETREPPASLGVASQQVRPARAGGRGVAGWFFQETVSGEALDARERAVARLLSLETRHPLALGHKLNHPPRGVMPNVMPAAFDFTAPPGEAALRAYVPNVTFRPAFVEEENERKLATFHGRPRARAAQDGVKAWERDADVAQGLALIALRDLKDEELFLNYRLSPHVAQPDWYWAVDPDENQRRWA